MVSPSNDRLKLDENHLKLADDRLKLADRFNPAKLYAMAQVKSASEVGARAMLAPNSADRPATISEPSADAIRAESDQAIVTESGESVPDQFSVKLPIKRFSRLWQLVGDYRLADGSKANELEQSKQQDETATDADSGVFEANFRLSKFADSSFVADMVAAAGSESDGGRSASEFSGEQGKDRKNASSKASDKRQSSKHAPKGGSLSSVSRGVRGDADERAATTPIIVATGDLKARLNLQCQRCLDTYEERIETDFRFAFAANEITADVLPETMDPVMLDEEGLISVVDMFEDELLLRLPTHAMHADESQCSDKAVPYQAHVVTKEQLADEVKADNPFAVLKNIDLAKGKK